MPEGVCSWSDALSIVLKYVFFLTQRPQVVIFPSLPILFYLSLIIPALIKIVLNWKQLKTH